LDALNLKSAIGWLTPQLRENCLSGGVQVFSLPGVPMRVDRPDCHLFLVFTSVLMEFHPDIIHFHTFGRSEAAIARWASTEGIPYVFTYHSPAWTCRREDLMAFDLKTPCDGKVRLLRCSACKVHERLNTPIWLSYFFVVLSLPFAIFLALFPQTQFRRRLAFLADTWMFRFELRRFLKKCSRVFACADWSVPLLGLNGAPQEHIVRCPQGVSRELSFLANDSKDDSNRQIFRIAFVGRVEPVKGVDILIEGFLRLKSRNVRLYIYGWPEDIPKSSFYEYIAKAAQMDARILLQKKLKMTEMLKMYQEIDLLCIPSVWPETGPLVLFEALQRGVPVFGSKRVGQLQLLEDRGKLIEPNTSEQWCTCLEEAMNIYSNGGWDAVCERAKGKEDLRTMADVAREVKEGYFTILPNATGRGRQ
jgi:glycosyltransferase involved in cell wall biosynthesis